MFSGDGERSSGTPPTNEISVGFLLGTCFASSQINADSSPTPDSSAFSSLSSESSSSLPQSVHFCWIGSHFCPGPVQVIPSSFMNLLMIPPMKFNGAAIASKIAWIGARITLTSSSNLARISFRMPSTSVSIKHAALLNTS